MELLHWGLLKMSPTANLYACAAIVMPHF